MGTKKELVVTFRLDASGYEDEGGVSVLAFARQDAWELIFHRAELNVLEALLRSAAYPCGDESKDQLFRSVLNNDYQAIQAAAQSATYEIVEIKGES